MMPAPARKQKAPTSLRRRALLGKVHMAKAQIGLSDDQYRDIMADRYNGIRTASKLSDKRLVDLIEFLKTLGFIPKPKRKSKKGPARAGSRPLAAGDLQAKIRALWLSLYHLGIVRDPAEAAMGAFVTRMSGVSALQWLDPEGANKTIEALKDWATRESGVNWSPHKVGEIVNPKYRVIEAQMRILAVNKLVEVIDLNGCTEDDADRVIEELGHKVRSLKKENSPQRPSKTAKGKTDAT